jgi:hypothetical protein
VLAAVAAFLIVALAVGFYWRSTRSAKLTDKDTIVLADFINTTGDPVFDGTLRQARTAYQDFFALWNDADPDIPILKQAKAEYAKLQ